jgi:hypothetical protein
MQFIRRFFAIITILIFIPLFIINIISINTKLTILNTNYIKYQFEKSDFFNSLITTGLPAFINSTMKSSTPDDVSQYQILTQGVEQTITPDFLKNNFNSLLDQINLYLLGKTNNIQQKIPLSDIKNSFDKNLSSYVSTQLNKLPTCTQNELNQLKNNSELKCLPPGFDPNEVAKAMNNPDKNELISSLPNDFELGDYLMQKYQNKFESFRRFINFYDIGIYIITAINILLLILIALLIWKPLHLIIKWISATLLISSATLVILTAIGLASSAIVSSSIVVTLPNEIQNIVRGLLLTIQIPFYLNLFYINGIIILISIIGLISSAKLEKNNSSKSQITENK